jgi:hypothetical protein
LATNNITNLEAYFNLFRTYFTYISSIMTQ